MPWTIPNILTVLRIALIPVFLLVYYLPFSWSHLATTALFGLAALTDWFDGYLARRLGAAGFTIFNLSARTAAEIFAGMALGPGSQPAVPPHHSCK